ncbi:MAG: class B sortase [Clostridiales bacterium]|nr:class B sortase [Clostridiales bacterium]
MADDNKNLNKNSAGEGAAPENNGDEFFNVSSFAEHLNSADGNGKFDLRSDDEQVIEPVDEDANVAAGEDGDNSGFYDDSFSPDDFIDKLRDEAQRTIADDFDNLKKEFSLSSDDLGAYGVSDGAGDDVRPEYESDPEDVDDGLNADEPYYDDDDEPFYGENGDRYSGGNDGYYAENDPYYRGQTPPVYDEGRSRGKYADAVRRAMENDGYEDYGARPSRDNSFSFFDGDDGGSGGYTGDDYEKDVKIDVSPAPVRKKKKKKKKKKGFFANLLPSSKDGTFEIFRKMLFLVSVATIIVCCGILGNTYLLQPYLAEKSTSDLNEIRSGSVSSIEDLRKQYNGVSFPQNIARVNLAEFYAINKDFYGYLEIKGFGLSQPVTHASDNNKYLRHNFYGNWNKYGCLFVDYRNTATNLDKNTIIYGHNMEYDDLMFGQLEKYRTVEGFKSAPVISLETLYAEHKFKVYAVFLTSANYDANGYFFDYIFTALSSDTAFGEYIGEVNQRRLYTTGVDIKNTDKILTLSTCGYDFDGERIVVIGRLVRDGEDETVDTSRTVVNSNPRYPDEWYKAKGKSNPYANASKWMVH